tara:strand:- start:68 stop:553 length:486 start_codon:yes stop_codon:yes gene_type:complete
MNDPIEGWKILTDLLKPSGLMKIGLYSELARNHIAKIREEISLSKVGSSKKEMSKFRKYLIQSDKKYHKKLLASSDFFSLSTLRDLIFHVQEHRFTIPNIQNCLNELGLKFCGFEDMDIVYLFKEFHGEESNIFDLKLWHQFEESNPDIFAGMYQFWCQKI